MTKTRREQQSAGTRRALLTAARRLIGKQGFAATAAEDIVAKARVTRGALYHHFPGGKPALFEALVRSIQEQLVEAMTQAFVAAKTPWAAVRATIQAYFDFADDPIYKQLILHDAPAVFGADAWRTMEHEYSLPFMEFGLADLMTKGEIRQLPVKLLAASIFGACCEATLTIAESKNEAVAKREAVDLIVALVEGLRED